MMINSEMQKVRIITAEIGLDRIPNQPYRKIDSVDPMEIVNLAHRIEQASRDISRLRAKRKSAKGAENIYIKKECDSACQMKEEYRRQLEDAWKSHHNHFSSGVTKLLSEEVVRTALANWDSIDATRFYHDEMTPSTVSKAYGLLSTLMMSADLGKNKARAAAITASVSGISKREYVHFFPEPWAVTSGELDTSKLNDKRYLCEMATKTVVRSRRITSPVYRLEGAPPRVAENWDQLEAAQRIIGRRVAQERSGSGIDIICCDYICDTIIEIHVPPIGLVGGYMASIDAVDESKSPIGLLERELEKHFSKRIFERAVVVANGKYEHLGLFRQEIDRIAVAMEIHAKKVDVKGEEISQAEMDRYDLVFLYGTPTQAILSERQEIINGKRIMGILDNKVSMLHFAREISDELNQVGIRIPTNYIVEGRNELPFQLQKYIQGVPKNKSGIPDISKVNDIATRSIMQGELIQLLRSQGINSPKVLIKPRVHRATLQTAHGSLTKPPFLDVSYLPMAVQALDIIVLNDGGIFEQQIEPAGPFVERRLYSIVVKDN